MPCVSGESEYRRGSRMNGGATSRRAGDRPKSQSDVSSIVIANDPDSGQNPAFWSIVIADDPNTSQTPGLLVDCDGRRPKGSGQRRQMCSSGSLPPFTGGSLCCQMRRQLAAGGSGNSAKPRWVFHQVVASSAMSCFTAQAILAPNSLTASSGRGTIGIP